MYSVSVNISWESLLLRERKGRTREGRDKEGRNQGMNNNSINTGVPETQWFGMSSV